LVSPKRIGLRFGVDIVASKMVKFPALEHAWRLKWIQNITHASTIRWLMPT